MTALKSCESNMTEASCGGLVGEELRDVYAYREWLLENAAKAPFATTVILHNLVTDSIAREKTKSYLRNTPDSKPRFACVSGAARAAEYVLGLAPGSFKPNVPRPTSPLPGIGKHRIIDCD